MFGWRKRRDGFEWRQYVRTTILVRRERRRQRVDELREVAVENLKDAGRKGVDLGAAGLDAAGRQVKRGVGAAFVSAGSAIAGAARRVRPLLSGRGKGARESLGPPLARAWAGLRERLDGVNVFAQSWGLGNGLVQVALLIGAIVGGTLLSARWNAAPRGIETASLSETRSGAVKPAASGSITGSAVARAGDVLRVGDTNVRLAGIQAPDLGQTCTRGNGKRWDCGQAAMQALSRQVRGKTVACELKGREVEGATLGNCRIGDDDIAAAHVAGGHAFAETGLFASYSGKEAEAKAAQAGIWSGEAERPSDYRAKRWDEARKAAPDGCPIKGQVSASNRVYVLPWQPSYEKVKVRTSRGERWFCSEADAIAAGWKPDTRGRS